MTDEESTEYNRMCVAVLVADELHRALTERAKAAEARIEEQKRAHAERKRMIDEARVVLDDCFASGEARSTAHALEALRRIICGTGLVAFGQPATPNTTRADLDGRTPKEMLLALRGLKP